VPEHLIFCLKLGGSLLEHFFLLLLVLGSLHLDVVPHGHGDGRPGRLARHAGCHAVNWLGWVGLIMWCGKSFPLVARSPITPTPTPLLAEFVVVVVFREGILHEQTAHLHVDDVLHVALRHQRRANLGRWHHGCCRVIEQNVVEPFGLLLLLLLLLRLLLRLLLLLLSLHFDQWGIPVLLRLSVH